MQEHSVVKKQKQAQARNLLNEYLPLLVEITEEIKKELNVDITGTTCDEVALEYKRRQGGREALNNFLQRLHSRSNER